MPNWVYNTINNYSKDVYEKYTDGKNAIDFNKLIPEPEEITNTTSGSTAKVAKQIYKYKTWKKNTEDHYKYDSPLYNRLNKQANMTAESIGYMCIENPDETLNELVKKDENKYDALRYEKYVELYGNKDFRSLTNEEFENSCDKYCDIEDKSFKECKKSHEESIKKSDVITKDNIDFKFDNITEYGKHLDYLENKYGFDNWYDWRCANWGTKWNACDSNYNEDEETLTFDTAWSVPIPILAKISQENPEKTMDVYSEEETGWFEEHQLKDGKISMIADGQLFFQPDSEETDMRRNVYMNPKQLSYDDIARDYIEYAKRVMSNI